MAIDAQTGAATPSLPSRRVSYVLSPALLRENPPRLELPGLSGAGRHPDRIGRGSSKPIIKHHPQQPNRSSRGNPFQISSAPEAAESSAPQHPRHTLPVTSLAIDASTSLARLNAGKSEEAGEQHPEGLLYTAGRDGVVASWELGMQMRKRTPRLSRRSAWSYEDGDGPYEDEHNHDAEAWQQHQGQDELSKARSESPHAKVVRKHGLDDGWQRMQFEKQWEVDVASMCSNQRRLPAPRFRSCVQSHTDWINDMLLCNSNQTVITASSDRFVRLWNPHDSASCLSPAVLGSHSDYAKALARPSGNSTSWVASAGLDQMVRLWDIGELRKDPLINIADKASIYCINTDSRGGMIAVGTPDNGIRLYDPRSHSASSGPVGQLLGHTDMIRSILLSSSGRHLLSSSSDGTVRLWDVGEQRLTHTFGHHSASVTALFSDCDDLSVFYSADRDGVVCKVDCENCIEPDEGECIVLAQTGGPVNKLVALDDAFVWTAGSGSDVKCWRDVPKKRSRQALYPIHGEVSTRGLKRETLHSTAFSASTVSTPSPLNVSGAETHPEDSVYQSTESAAKVRTETIPHHKLPLPSALKAAGSSNSVIPVLHHVQSAERSPTPPPLTGPHSRVSFSLSASHDPASSKSCVFAMPTDKVAPLVPHVKPNATLFGIPFESLVTLDSGDDPYGLGTGLSTAGALLTGGSHKGARGPMLHLGARNGSAAHLAASMDGRRGSSFSLGRNSFALEGVPAASMNMARLAQLRAASAQAGVRGQHPVQLPSAMGRRSISASIRFLDGESPAEASQPERNADDVRPGEASGAEDKYEGEEEEEEEEEEADDDAMLARRAYEERDLAVKATPLRSEPECHIHGTRGLIRSCMLNDRQHVLTYSPPIAPAQGSTAQTTTPSDEHGPLVALWDILRCRCVGIFHGPEVAALWEMHDTPGDILEKVRSHIEGFGASPTWCSVDTRSGALAVHMEASAVFDAEVYLDECDWIEPTQIPRSDQRANVGKWLLRSLFEGFVRTEELLRDSASPALRPGHLAAEHPGVVAEASQVAGRREGDLPQSSGERYNKSAGMVPDVTQKPQGQEEIVSRAPGNTLSLAIAPSTSAMTPTGISPLTPINPHGWSHMTMQPKPVDTTAAHESQRMAPSSDYFSLGKASHAGKGGSSDRASEQAIISPETPASTQEEQVVTPSVVTPGGGLISRWGAKLRNKDKSVGGANAEKGSPEQANRSATLLSPTELDTTLDSQRSTDASSEKDEPIIVQARQTLLKCMPVSPMPLSDAPALRLPYLTSISISASSPDAAQWQTIYRGVVASTQRDAGPLEVSSPPWLLEFLLANQTAAHSTANSGKMSFILFPEPGPEDASPRRPPLPALPSGEAKLTATKMIRLVKVSQYICEKLGHSSTAVFSNNTESAAHSRAASIAGGSRRPSAENLTTGTGLGVSSALRKQRLPSVASTTDGDELDLAPITPQTLVLTCNGTVLDPYTTLIQIARFYWKSSGDVRIGYRRRLEGSEGHSEPSIQS
ncbi:unnamed protein product [Parajaminaea phylloscopi]